MKPHLLLLLTALSLFAEPATLIHIADGDTMTYKTASGEKVTCRVAYIDTPEKFATAKLAKDAQKAGISPEQIQKAGWAASDYAKKVLGPVGRKHEIRIFEKDKYGRSLCEIYDETAMLYNAKVVADGYAVVYQHGKYIKDSRTKNSLLELQQKAKIQGKGLWGSDRKVMEGME